MNNNFFQLSTANNIFNASLFLVILFALFFFGSILYFLSKISQIEKALYASLQQQKRIADILEKEKDEKKSISNQS